MKTYIDWSRADSINADIFSDTKPFPWMNPQGFLTTEGFNELQQHLPDISLFKKTFNVERGYGQQSHDRWELKWRNDVSVSEPWRNFVQELEGERYRTFLARLFKTESFVVRYQWQYATRGCSVSPHCDSQNKIGSQIFYFNTANDWKEEWGGQTLALDDGGKFKPESAPQLEEFAIRGTSVILGNKSFIFQRTPHSWHAVKALECPEGAYRKIFTVVVDKKREPENRPGSITGQLRKLFGFS